MAIDQYRRSILEAIAQCGPRGATAEAEAPGLGSFLPIPAHARALEPQILVVLGCRGSGKTRLFRVLSESGAGVLLLADRGRSVLPVNECTFLVGFKKAKPFPEAQVVSRALDGAPAVRLRAFWTGLLAAAILRGPEGDLVRAAVGEAFAARLQSTAAVSEWLPLVEQKAEPLSLALDALDDSLAARERRLVVTYDDLDLLTVEFPALRPMIRELLAYWLEQWRRRPRILPKVFLRTDLFQQEYLAFPDGAKLKGNTLSLEWDTSWLYRLLFKHMANASPVLRDFLRQVPGFVLEEDPTLGWMPGEDEVSFKAAINELVGPYMGASSKKGETYPWVIIHIQDANGTAVPRSMLKLFSKAAELQLREEPAARILSPSALQGALMETSQERLSELCDEYPWLDGLRVALEGLQVPARRPEVAAKLDGANKLLRDARSRSGDEVIDRLLALGVLRRTGDDRLHVPDIYLYGLGLKRKGGVKRPRRVGTATR